MLGWHFPGESETIRVTVTRSRSSDRMEIMDLAPNRLTSCCYAAGRVCPDVPGFPSDGWFEAVCVANAVANDTPAVILWGMRGIFQHIFKNRGDEVLLSSTRVHTHDFITQIVFSVACQTSESSQVSGCVVLRNVGFIQSVCSVTVSVCSRLDKPAWIIMNIGTFVVD